MASQTPIRLLDTVELVSDIPELGLSAGEVGAVVDFCNESGYTYGRHTLRAHHLVRLHTRGHSLRTRLEAA